MIFGGAAAVAMIVATCAAGLLAMESGRFVLTNCLYAGAAGLAAGSARLAARSARYI